MNSNLILKTDILDIIFEKRNKAYGAYELRKLYPNRLKTALGFMFVTAIAFSAFTFFVKKNESSRIIFDNIPEIFVKEIAFDAPRPPKPPQLEKGPAKAAVPVNQTKLINNLLIVQDITKTDIIKTVLPTDAIGKENIDNAKSSPAVVQPAQSQANSGGSTEKIVPKIDINTPMDANAVDILPSFPGGMEALKAFLERNLRNPSDRENGETIAVKVRFVVGYNGKLQSFTTVEDGGDTYNKEVIRVLKKMPDWIPGKAKGENVSVYYTIPVKFVMSN
jgi:protein TonB